MPAGALAPRHLQSCAPPEKKHTPVTRLAATSIFPSLPPEREQPLIGISATLLEYSTLNSRILVMGSPTPGAPEPQNSVEQNTKVKTLPALMK